MRIVTAAEMRALEASTAARGHSYEMMMELAGRATAEEIASLVTLPDGQIVFLIGPGNNGGDGLVAARYLHQQGYQVACLALVPRPADDPNALKLAELGLAIRAANTGMDGTSLSQILAGCSVIVDALFGTGMHGPLRGIAPTILRQVHEYILHAGKGSLPTITPFTEIRSRTRPLVVAVDMPSGLDADNGKIDENALKADVTVTFGYPKPGHFTPPGAAFVGKLSVADIGLAPPENAPHAPQSADSEMVRKWLPLRSCDSNKGTFGSALIVGGSASYCGAPRLAGEAAYRAGAGLVTLAVPSRVYASAACQLPDATYLPLDDNADIISERAVDAVRNRLEHCAAWLLGPGMGNAPETRGFLNALLGLNGNPTQTDEPFSLPPMVVDADGLNLLATIPLWWQQLPAGSILTPHPGEMARLCGCSVKQVQADRWQIARDRAQQWGCTVVLKGAFTVCASPLGELVVLPFANSLLAVAGTGDVLAGTITGLLTQKVPAFQSAVCGSFLHGLAGEYKRKELGDSGLLAHDLLPLLAQAANDIRKS